MFSELCEKIRAAEIIVETPSSMDLYHIDNAVTDISDIESVEATALRGGSFVQFASMCVCHSCVCHLLLSSHINTGKCTVGGCTRERLAAINACIEKNVIRSFAPVRGMYNVMQSLCGKAHGSNTLYELNVSSEELTRILSHTIHSRRIGCALTVFK